MNADPTIDLRVDTPTPVMSMEETSQRAQTLPASYNSLPKELKLDIWEQAYPDAPGRVIHIQCSPTKARSKPGYLSALGKKHFLDRSSPPSNVTLGESSPAYKFSLAIALRPSLEYADAVSREVAMKRSERIFPGDSIHQHIRADLSKDILLFSVPLTGNPIAPVLSSFLAEISIAQKSRLKYAAFECRPVARKWHVFSPRAPENRLSNLRKPSLPNLIASSSLEMVAFIGGYGGRGDNFGEGQKPSGLKFLEVRNRNDGEGKKAESFDQTKVLADIRFRRSDWSVQYARIGLGGQSGADNNELVVQCYIVVPGVPGGRLIFWNARRNQLTTEFVMRPSSEQLQLVNTYVEQVGRHYANAATGRGMFTKA